MFWLPRRIRQILRHLSQFVTRAWHLCYGTKIVTKIWSNGAYVPSQFGLSLRGWKLVKNFHLTVTSGGRQDLVAEVWESQRVAANGGKDVATHSSLRNWTFVTTSNRNHRNWKINFSAIRNRNCFDFSKSRSICFSGIHAIYALFLSRNLSVILGARCYDCFRMEIIDTVDDTNSLVATRKWCNILERNQLSFGSREVFNLKLVLRVLQPSIHPDTIWHETKNVPESNPGTTNEKKIRGVSNMDKSKANIHDFLRIKPINVTMAIWCFSKSSHFHSCMRKGHLAGTLREAFWFRMPTVEPFCLNRWESLLVTCGELRVGSRPEQFNWG